MFSETSSAGMPSNRSLMKSIESIEVAKDGTRRVRIHAVGFPTVMQDTNGPGNTGERFATLMRILCQKNGGTFVGLNSTWR